MKSYKELMLEAKKDGSWSNLHAYWEFKSPKLTVSLYSKSPHKIQYEGRKLSESVMGKLEKLSSKITKETWGFVIVPNSDAEINPILNIFDVGNMPRRFVL